MIHSIFAFLFLSPLTALLTAVGAASIPIIIHLLNRNRFRVVPWAAMRFLLAAQKRTVRKLRIEQWLLLAIRTLLILLLILAMVSVLPWLEPVWNRAFPGGGGPGVVKTGRTHRIIVMDGSFSMGRKHPDGTSFDRARDLARRIVQSASPGDGFSLMLLGSPVQTIVPGPSDNAANVTTEIQQLRMPHGNSDLAGGIAALDKMAAAPLGKYQRREVYFLTDMQKTFFQGGLKTSGAKPDSPGADPKGGEPDAWQRLQSRRVGHSDRCSPRRGGQSGGHEFDSRRAVGDGEQPERGDGDHPQLWCGRPRSSESRSVDRQTARDRRFEGSRRRRAILFEDLSTVARQRTRRCGGSGHIPVGVYDSRRIHRSSAD